MTVILPGAPMTASAAMEAFSLRIVRSTHAPAPTVDYGSRMESRTTAPFSTVTPGERMELYTSP